MSKSLVFVQDSETSPRKLVSLQHVKQIEELEKGIKFIYIDGTSIISTDWTIDDIVEKFNKI